MARMAGLPRQYQNLTKYRAAVARSPFVTSIDQWRAFATVVPAFARDQHDVYFDTILPIARQAVYAPIGARSVSSMQAVLAGTLASIAPTR
jgi:hypothetical protein